MILIQYVFTFTYDIFIDFTDEDVEAILNMVFCACDEGNRDGVLSLDEFTSEVCEVSRIGAQIREQMSGPEIS